MAITDSLQGFLGGAGGLSPESITGIFSSPGFAKIFFFIKVFIYLLVFIGFVIGAWKLFFSYNIRATIKRRIGNGGIEVHFTRAKIIVDKQGKRKLVVFKRFGKKEVTCPVPAAQFKGKVGKHDHYELWLDDNFQLHPIENPNVDSDHVYLAVRPQERDAWARYEDKRMKEVYQRKDLLEKYLPAGVMIVACITAFLMFFFGFKELGAAMANLASQIGQVASSCVVR